MVATEGNGWRVAPSIVALFEQADKLWPNRSEASDGTIGDPSHAARQSDHNPDYSNAWRQPDGKALVHAGDLTHSPAAGVDIWRIANDIKNRRDLRVQYLVVGHNGEDWIWNADRDREGWRRTGKRDHLTHLHVSIRYTAQAESDTSSWFGPVATTPDDDEEIDVPFLPVRRPLIKAGPNKASSGRVPGYTVSGTSILGWHGAALAGDRAVDGTDRVEPAPHTEVRILRTKSAHPLVDLFYWINEDGEVELDKIGAFAKDGGTFGPYRCT